MSETAPPAYTQQPSHKNSTLVLVLGLLSIFCCGVFAGIPGIILGRNGLKEVEQSGGAVRAGNLKAGFILSIIGTVLSILGVLVWIIFLVSAGKAIHDNAGSISAAIASANAAMSHAANPQQATNDQTVAEGAAFTQGTFAFAEGWKIADPNGIGLTMTGLSATNTSSDPKALLMDVTLYNAGTVVGSFTCATDTQIAPHTSVAGSAITCTWATGDPKFDTVKVKNTY